MLTSDFRYPLPESAIAQSAIEPRDAARLLDARDLTDHTFAELPALLRAGDLVVVNTTRVRRARLRATKDTGGAVEVLLLGPDGDGVWEALVRPVRRVRAGTRLGVAGAVAEVVAVTGEGVVRLRPVSGSLEAAAEAGEPPLPPYFHGTLADPERYQTIYARRAASSAAPTAGLHFTAGVLAGLRAAGIALAEVELEIGLGTFRPIAAPRLDEHRMHPERVVVGEAAVQALEEARSRQGRVVAVGTTVVRALEAAASGGALRPFAAATDLFITPGFRFRVVDFLVTNFHLPASSLVVLVAAFMGPRWRDAYEAALGRGYRFLSFGDAMLAGRAG